MLGFKKGLQIRIAGLVRRVLGRVSVCPSFRRVVVSRDRKRFIVGPLRNSFENITTGGRRKPSQYDAQKGYRDYRAGAIDKK